MKGLSDGGTADDRPPLENPDAMTPAGQACGADQAIVACADDDDFFVRWNETPPDRLRNSKALPSTIHYRTNPHG